ncbi:hypothetical protein ADIS_2122 [Lunatimonas lonarensis]|uniref:Uncharacterized protein n=1 Tax=Lunatimonas lonarensis TaxID=1232681 RepID=R7ZTP2_9BACT|nr:hypothetical protein ADIS_2122 [Lunatimonas lonarensis]
MKRQADQTSDNYLQSFYLIWECYADTLFLAMGDYMCSKARNYVGYGGLIAVDYWKFRPFPIANWN